MGFMPPLNLAKNYCMAVVGSFGRFKLSEVGFGSRPETKKFFCVVKDLLNPPKRVESVP